MIRHLIQNNITPQTAHLAKSRLRSKLSELEMALEGFLTDHHRVPFKISLQMTASYDEAIEKLNEEIDRKMKPYIETSQKLQTIPGVKKVC
jgi:hypothetical protein